MKLTTIVLLVLLVLNIPKAQAKVALAKPDSTRDEFNLKKKSTVQLIIGKSPTTMLIFYEFYLQEKDLNRADSLISDIVKSSNAIDHRHQISLTSNRYTADPKTKLLFLPDADRVKEYRGYFLKFDTKSMKSNSDMRAHYQDLVALDSAYYKISKDTLVRRQMGRHYNSLAWYSILTQKLDNVAYYLNQSTRYDPQSKYPYSNRPLYLLLKGHYQEARELYIKLKDQPFDTPNATFKDEFLEDFKELAEVGVTNDDIKKITKLLNSKQNK